MIIQALTTSRNKPKKYNEKKIPDIIRTDYQEIEEYEGTTKIIRRIPVKVNLTKKINATAKLIKRESVKEIEAKLDEVFELKKAELEKAKETMKKEIKK